MFKIGSFTFDTTNKHMIIDTGINTVNIQDVYDAQAEWASAPANMIYDVPATGGGKFKLGPDKFTGLVVRMDDVKEPSPLGVWKLKFPAAAGPGIERRTISGGDFIGENEKDPIAGSANIFPVVELSTSPTLVVTGGLTEADKTEIAELVWDTPLRSVSGSFGEWTQKKLLTVVKFLGLK